MIRDDIYDHLAQVYLGKRSKEDDKKKKQLNAWLFLNVIMTFMIFGLAFYGLTAFLAQKGSSLEKSIIFSLYNGPMRIAYDLTDDFPPVKSFVLKIPEMDASEYRAINFSLRGKEEGTPGIVKVLLKNKKNESAYYYVQGVDLSWKQYSISLDDFTNITDWTNLEDITFVLESWNVDKKKGIVLIDDVYFSS